MKRLEILEKDNSFVSTFHVRFEVLVQFWWFFFRILDFSIFRVFLLLLLIYALYFNYTVCLHELNIIHYNRHYDSPTLSVRILKYVKINQ